jgi:simple sugar transport system ATP-binding protein
MELCDNGMAVVFISSEMAEALRYSDRVVILRDRRKVADIAADQTDEHAVYQIIAGGQA